MSDGQTLYLVLVLLYFVDCVLWVGTRTVLFAAPWCWRWRVAFAGPNLGNTEGSLALTNPLPPLGTVLATYWLPISLSGEGVCSFRPQALGESRRSAPTKTVLTYGQIQEVGTDGKELLLNGKRFAKCESPSQAWMLAELIGRAKKASGKKRERLLQEFFAARFSVKDAKTRLELANRLSGSVRLCGLMFLFYLYIFVPAVVWRTGLERHIIPTAIAMLLSAILISAVFFLAHRQLYPDATSQRIGHVFKMVLCPPAAIRAHDHVVLGALTAFHPLVAAQLVLDKGEAQSLAGSVLRDLACPLPYQLDDPQAAAIVAWHAATERAAAEAFLRQECELVPDDLLAPPAWDGHGTVYCPRCHGQLNTTRADCPDCPGVSLLPTPQARS